MKRMMLMWAMLALTATACGGAGAQAKNESCCDDKAAALAASDAAPVAGLPAEAVCPVSGEKFKPDAGTKTAQYKGKTVYFCCPGCDAKFAANPAKYEGNIAQ